MSKNCVCKVKEAKVLSMTHLNIIDMIQINIRFPFKRVFLLSPRGSKEPFEVKV
jgi:hypothetical protein